MFRREISPTFSDLWYRVAPHRPRLSPHAPITRQVSGGTVGYVVEDSATGGFYRVTEAGYRFVGLLDGRRTVNDAWEACIAQLGDDAPTQKECIDLLAQCHAFGLLLGDVPVWADMAEERRSRALTMKRQRRFGNGLFFNIPLINPDRWLDRTRHLYAWAYGPVGAAVWLATFLVAGFMLASNIDRFGRGLDAGAMLDPRNLAMLGVVFLVLRTVHEFGHATACKAMGGRCPEIGLMLVAVVLPLPYCDATSSWRFPETWRRVLVAAAGVLVETFLAAIAAILWARSEPGTLSAICYNVMIVSGITTLVFNMNPLLRYDGYYILSDLAGIPNLAQRAKDLWKYLIDRYAFAVRSVNPPPLRSLREAIFVGVYGALSLPYRVFVSFGICLVVAQRYSSLGLVLAALVAAMVLAWPLLKGVGYLLWSPVLLGRRARAAGVTLAALGVLAAVIGLYPARARVYAPAWVEPSVHDVVRAGESGFVAEVLARAGEMVEKGEPLVRLENYEIVEQHAVATARLEQALAARDLATMKSAAEARAADAQVTAARYALERSAERMEALTIRAPVAGRFVAEGGTAADVSNLVGSFMTRGTLIGHVSTVDTLVVHALVDDLEHAYALGRPEGVRASVRVRGDAGRVVPARIERIAPAGSRSLQNAALASVAGGDIQVESATEDRVTALRPQFLVKLAPEGLAGHVLPGQRARVRLEVGRAPLAVQWARRARQFWMSRFAP